MGQSRTDDLRGAAFVCVVQIAVQEADGDRLDALRRQRGRGRGDLGLIEGMQHRTGRIDAFRHLQAALARHQRHRRAHGVVVEMRPHLAADLQHVAKSSGDDQPGGDATRARSPCWWRPWCHDRRNRSRSARCAECPAASRSPPSIASDGSAGVDGTLKCRSIPLVVSCRVKSVNVPPTSKPMRYMQGPVREPRDCACCGRRAQAVGAGPWCAHCVDSQNGRRRGHRAAVGRPTALEMAPRSYQGRLTRTSRTTVSITGTSTRTPTTVASAAPDRNPNSAMAVATASSKKFEAPISAEGTGDAPIDAETTIEPIREAGVEIDLHDDRNGKQQNDQRLVHDLIALQPEQQNQGQQQGRQGRGTQATQRAFQADRAAGGETRRAPKLRDDHRHHDVQHDRQQQRVPRHADGRQAEQQTDDRRERHHHDRVIQRDLAQGEMRLAIDQVRPDEHHGGARRGRQQDQAGDVEVDLVRRQQRAEQVADEQPAEQRHGERLDQPVHPHGGGDAAPVPADLGQRARIDLQQHRHDHQPHQDGNRQVHLRDRRIADRVEHAGRGLAERDAGNDAQCDPEREGSVRKYPWRSFQFSMRSTPASVQSRFPVIASHTERRPARPG